MVTLENNKAYIEYIKSRMMAEFKDISPLNEAYEGLPNNNFSIDFLFNNDKIIFVKDRGYIELRIKSEQDYINLNKIDDKINNLILSVEGIDYYINFLKTYYGVI